MLQVILLLMGLRYLPILPYAKIMAETGSDIAFEAVFSNLVFRHAHQVTQLSMDRSSLTLNRAPYTRLLLAGFKEHMKLKVMRRM
jgi:hypothetical protein